MASSTGAERMTDGFWEGQMDIVNSRQAVWYREHVNRQGNEDYSAGGRLPGETERVVGSRMFLAGELVDQFLREVGIAITEKLCRSKSTGEMQATSQFVPPRVHRSNLRWLWSSRCSPPSGEDEEGTSEEYSSVYR